MSPLCILTTVAHNRGVSDFEFSPLNTLIATSSRNDGIVRLWNIPDDITLQDSQREITQPESLLRGHEKKVENIQFHPTVANILFSASTYDIFQTQFFLINSYDNE